MLCIDGDRILTHGGEKMNRVYLVTGEWGKGGESLHWIGSAIGIGMNGEGGTWIRSKEQYCFDSKSRNADSSQERKGLMEASMGVSLNNDNCCSLNGDGAPPLFINSLSLT